MGSIIKLYSLSRNVKYYDIFGDSENRKNCNNSIPGINNVVPKPEPNMQKNIFFDNLSIFMGCSKMTFFRKIFYELFSHSGSPVHGETNDTMYASNQPKLMEIWKPKYRTPFQNFRSVAVCEQKNFSKSISCVPQPFSKILFAFFLAALKRSYDF